MSYFLKSSIFEILGIISLFIYLLGISNIHYGDRTNSCEMTYMFEYPQFVKVSFPENKLYPQYGLYAYSEGRLTERARNMWFDGVPVLYLPGNSGSHMQGRSIASVALRKALSGNFEFHFDFFMIGYNEELSGLYGGVLNSQTEFAAACISQILSLYKENKYTDSVPTSVIIIGHSMGGLIAKRLLAYPETLLSTQLAITLATPLDAPVLNCDIEMNTFYKQIEYEWNTNIHDNGIQDKKVLLSFGNNAKDILIPPGLTASNESDISGLTTAVPGVWISPDHVSIVWCKQLVMIINKFLFSIVDPSTRQIYFKKRLIVDQASRYFKANRSMNLNSNIVRGVTSMVADGFWYEDNRRIYQVNRPDINKMTYVMIRLTKFPQNRFVAIESVNVDDKDWLFGCTANQVYANHRYCKQGTQITELSRWTGSAINFRKRKLATVNLYDIGLQNPDWTHVVVKVSPTRKPITLNVDINDYESRKVTVNLPYVMSTSTTVIKETVENSLYYELILPDFNAVHQTYLLYVEPVKCDAVKYHVSAELNVPWAENHGFYHYFTHAKHTPMILQLFKTNPNISKGIETTQQAKVIILLDPQCTFTVSISSSWYHSLGQLARNCLPMLMPNVAAIILLAARHNLNNFQENGKFISIHEALMTDTLKPYACLIFVRFGLMGLRSVLALLSGWNNSELRYFTHSLYVVPAYMVALGLVNVIVLILLCIMVFSSQLANKLLFRILWRGGGTKVVEKLANVLQKLPMVVSATLVFIVPLSCGAAAMAVGAAFYFFMVSKMYEDYLEEFTYKLLAKVLKNIRGIFRSKKESPKNNIKEINEGEKDIIDDIKEEDDSIPLAISQGESDKKIYESNEISDESDKSTKDKTKSGDDSNKTDVNKINVNDDNVKCDNNETICDGKIKSINSKNEEENDIPNTAENEDTKALIEVAEKKCENEIDVDEELSNIHFHMTMLLLWVVVTVVNIPALLTWARNFKYSTVLKPDTSYECGFVMALCSTFVWQIEKPKKRLQFYTNVSNALFVTAVMIMLMGPYALYYINYGVTTAFAMITLQQVLDVETEEIHTDTAPVPSNSQNDDNDTCDNQGLDDFKNLKEKLNSSEELG